MHKTSFKKSLLVAALSLTMANMATAANVPADANLAKKQELVWNVSANPATLDPQKMEGDVEGYFARQLFEMLVTSDEKGHILPGAATSWQHSDDFKTWTFFLRPNAKWSNGDAVTAHDFVYAWQRLADPNTASPYASYLDFLKLENADKVLEGKAKVDELGVEAKDDHTLVLHLTESVPYVDKLVEHYVLSPVHKSVVEKFGDAWTKPGNLVGNGAFKLDSMVVNEKAVLVRNPHYWDNDKTVLEKVTLLPIESAATDVARYRAGDEDVTGKELPIELFAKLKKGLK
ncbi:ABC transporter substrate-binding protein [Gallibacterium anatis]|nr:ABC transporter substrate-binding protein [Gallibacterium anatis]